ncbi:hypothetical protein E4T42_05239 [Aureobasidium subglaciale]|nr:hypothetical protein E4T42_05239 [Aureobasidium subglaciale]
MTAHTEPLVHHEEGDDYLDDCVSTDGFTPSLPSLTNRAPDTDAQSVSDVDSISNGDTISDAASDADYDEIGYDEIPALAARARYQEMDPSEEDMERVMMSDRTIIPDTPTMAQRMPVISSEPVVKPFRTADYTRVIGLSLADKPYQMPNRPFRLVYLADANKSNMDVAIIVAKVVGAVTGNSEARDSVLTAASCAQSEDAILSSLYELPMPIEVLRAVTFDTAPDVCPSIKTSDGKTHALGETKPDLVIFHRVSFHKALVSLAQSIALHGIAMMEIEDDSFGLTDSGMDSSCIIPHTAQGGHCIRMYVVSSSDGEGENNFHSQVPLSSSAFHALEDDVLSRHLAYLANRTEAVSEKKKDKMFVQTAKRMETSKLMSMFDSSILKTIAQSILGLFIVLFAASLPAYFLYQESPASELTLRTPLLQVALNSSGLSSINASEILRYPTTTSVTGNSTTTAVAFPTAVHVYVAKSDQLLVSLPKAYWKSAQIGVFKNGKALSHVNNSRIIDGVLSISLPSTDAHGQIQVSVLSTNTPLRNETVKVDLGNRLLQRVTYENAAKGVQQDVTEVHHAARLAQAKVISDVQSVFNTSVYRVRSLGSNMLEGMKSTGNAIGSASNRTSHGLSYVGGLTYNKTSSLGSFVKSTIPQRRHFVRARTNALKIRTRLFRKSTTVKQNIVKPRPAMPQALTSLKARLAELQNKLSSGVDALKKSSPLKQRCKASSTASKVKVTIKTVIEPKAKKATSPVTDMIKGAKIRKQDKVPDKKLK